MVPLRGVLHCEADPTEVRGSSTQSVESRPGPIVEGAGGEFDEHRQGFAAAMAGLVAEFNAYLESGHADPTADLVGYRQIPLWLTEDKIAELIGEVRSSIVSRMNNEPALDRRMYLLSPILFPIEEARQPPPNN